MTWTAAIMSDDNLDPDSLVGRILRPSVDDVTWEMPKEFRVKGARVSGADGEPIAEFVFNDCTMKNGETYRLSFDEGTGTVRPELLEEAAIKRAELPLWRIMEQANRDAHLAMVGPADTYPDGWVRAAEIEALRDWLLPNAAKWYPHRELHAILTEQARIAREQ